MGYEKSIDTEYIQFQQNVRNNYKINTSYIYRVMGMAVKSVSIRIEEEMLDKIGYVASYEGRSVNSHILVLVRENIKAFESAHGKIRGEIPPDDNVKPPKR